ncbi:MAG: MFS transporter [Promethearchaeota archaeon]
MILTQKSPYSHPTTPPSNSSNETLSDASPSRQTENDLKSPSYTSDFKVMLQIVFFNGSGMFYMEFMVTYIAITMLFASGVELGVFFSLQVFGYLISTLTAGILTDRIAKTKLILVGSFGRGLGYLFFYFAILSQSLSFIGVATFTVGFAAGFFWIPFNAMIAEKSSPDNRSHAYGRRSSALGFGITAGSVVGFWIFFETINTSISPWLVYSPLILYAAANVFAGFQFILRVDENVRLNSHPLISDFDSNSDSALDNSTQTDKSALSSEVWSRSLKIGFLYIMIVLVLASINSSIGRPFVQPFFLENLSSDPNVVLMVYLPGGIIQMLLAPRIGRLADKLPPKVSVTISGVAGALLTYFWVNSSQVWVVAILWTLDNTIISLGFLTVQNLLSRMSTQYRGKIFGSQETIVNLGGLLGPILGGLAWDYRSMKSPFYISIIVELLLIPFYWAALRLLLPHLIEKTSTEQSEISLSNPAPSVHPTSKEV